MSNLKKYNIFIFITSFSKGLTQLFLPLILYDYGFSIKKILLFMIFKYLFCVINIPLVLKINKKYNWNKIMILSSVFFSLSYIYMNFISECVYSLIILAYLFSLHLSMYWLGRHIYGLSIIEDKKCTDNVSLYTIFTILGTIPSSLIGSIILKKFGFIYLSIIILLLMIVSIIPLSRVKSSIKYKKVSIEGIIKTFPKRNYMFVFVEQFRYVLNNIFPLFIYLYISKDIKYIGLTNLICSFSSIIFIFFISKKMDKYKKDYLLINSILLSICYLFKLNIFNNSIFYIIVFIEGLFKVVIDNIVNRNTYVYGKNYDIPSYIVFIELLNNISRVVILLFYYLLGLSIKSMLYMGVLGIFINAFIKFDDGKYGYSRLNK